MRKLLNTLYICSDDLYLSLENDNVIVWKSRKEMNRIPLITLESIVTFSRKGFSIPLITACSRHGIPIFLMSTKGELIAEISVPSQGSIYLKKDQYKITTDKEKSTALAADILRGKIHNQKHVLDRYSREHGPCSSIGQCASTLKDTESKIDSTQDLTILRGIEGEASRLYFSVFDNLITNDSEHFRFHGRSRRPPADRINAMLSYGYTLLHNECTAALESNGLDAAAGFLHEDHPGRKSLACDLVEEFRASIVDRFVLSLVNRSIIQPSMFEKPKEGGIYLNKEGRKLFLHHWQLNKKTEIHHIVFDETIPLGLIPYAQALLLARVIRGNMKRYIPFKRR